MITDIKMNMYRASKQRSALLDLLKSTKSHPTAAWLYENLKGTLPDLSLGTVYRNLTVLEEQGLAKVLPSGSGVDRFDADMSGHYHVTCEVCGKVEDVDMPFGTECEAEAVAASGYFITAHRLDFYGICPECRKKKESAR